MLFYLKEAIQELLQVQELDEVVITRTEIDAEAVLYFFFAKGGARPFLAVKMSGHESSNESLKNEYENLATVRNALPAVMEGTIPKTYISGMLKGHFYFAQDFVSGDLMGGILGENPGAHAISRIGLAWKWLNEFQAYDSAETADFDAFQFEHFIELCQRAYDIGGGEQEQIGELRESLKNFSGNKIPAVLCHGDLFPGNIIIDGSDVSVIDWHYFRKAYHPVFDVATFLSTFSSSGSVKDADEDVEKHFRLLFFEENAGSSHFLSLVGKYIRDAKLSLELFLKLFELSLLEWTTREYAVIESVTDKDRIWRRRFQYYLDNKADIIFHALNASNQ